MTILVANEDAMILSHSSKLVVYFDNNKIYLDDMLLVPVASRNLLSAHHLCVDNDMVVEFDK